MRSADPRVSVFVLLPLLLLAAVPQAWVPAAWAQTCAAGKYVSTGNTCFPCGIGKYQDSNSNIDGQESCKECPTQTDKSSGATFCAEYSCDKVSSPVGSSVVNYDCTYFRAIHDEVLEFKARACDDGEVLQCAPCGPGLELRTITIGLPEKECAECPKGQYSPTLNIFGSLEYECTVCPRGYYQNDKAKPDCKICPSGYEPDASRSSFDRCKRCSIGTDSPGGDSACRQASSSSSGGTTPAVCNAPQYFDGASGGCKYCPAGFFVAEDRMTSCVECTAGQFQDKPAQNRCVDCPEGFYQDGQRRSASCTRCPAGQFSHSSNIVCLDATVDETLPTPGDLSVTMLLDPTPTPTPTLNQAAVTWSTIPNGRTGTECDLMFSDTVDFDPNPARTASTPVFCDTLTARVNASHLGPDFDFRRTVVYFRMRLNDPDNDKRVSPWGPITKAWKAAVDCSDDQFLDTSPSAVDPLRWECAACPPLASCSGDVLVGDILPQHGAWSCGGNDGDETVMPRFQECLDPSACVGEADFGCNASNGHTSSSYADNPLCSVCAAGFMPSTSLPGRCIQCEEGGQVFLFIFALLVMITILVILLGLKMRSSGGVKSPHSGLKRTLLGHIQMVGLLMALDVSWPPAVRNFLAFFDSLSTAGTGGATGLLCSSRRGPSEIYYAFCILVALLPPLSVVASYGYWIYLVPTLGWTCRGTLRDDTPDATGTDRGTAISVRSSSEEGKTVERAAAVKRRGKRRWTPTDALYATNVLICYIVVPVIMRIAFRLMRCTDVCGVSRLHVDLTVECFADGHAGMAFGVVVPAILVYACILPLGALWYIRRKRAALRASGAAAESKSFMFRFGLLYSGYSSTRWYWESVAFARKFFTILLVSLGGGAAALQCHLALGLITLCLHLQHQYRPFYPGDPAARIHPDQRMLHRIETWSLSILTVTIFSSALFTKNLRELYTPLGDFMAAVMILTNVAFISVNTYAMCVYFGRKNKVGKLLKDASTRIELQWSKIKRRVSLSGESSESSLAGSGGGLSSAGGGASPPRDEGGSEKATEAGVEVHNNPVWTGSSANAGVEGQQAQPGQQPQPGAKRSALPLPPRPPSQGAFAAAPPPPVSAVSKRPPL